MKFNLPMKTIILSLLLACSLSSCEAVQKASDATGLKPADIRNAALHAGYVFGEDLLAAQARNRASVPPSVELQPSGK